MIFLRYIIHRGFHNEKNEENKMPAFIKALNDKRYAGVETDIRETKDHVFVLYHDPLYHGKLINSVNYKEMQKDNIPKLTDLLKIETTKILLLEIKDFNLNIPRLIKTLKKYNRNIYLMSFSNAVIAQIAKFKTGYKLGTLNYVFNTIDDYPYDFICLLNGVLTPKVIAAYQKLKVEIFSYGVRSTKDMIYNLTYIVENKIL